MKIFEWHKVCRGHKFGGYVVTADTPKIWEDDVSGFSSAVVGRFSSKRLAQKYAANLNRAFKDIQSLRTPGMKKLECMTVNGKDYPL